MFFRSMLYEEISFREANIALHTLPFYVTFFILGHDHRGVKDICAMQMFVNNMGEKGLFLGEAYLTSVTLKLIV